MEWLSLFVKLVLWTATLTPPADGLGDVAEWERSAAVRLEPSPASDDSPFARDPSRLVTASSADPQRPCDELYVGNGRE